MSKIYIVNCEVCGHDQRYFTIGEAAAGFRAHNSTCAARPISKVIPNPFAELNNLLTNLGKAAGKHLKKEGG